MTLIVPWQNTIMIQQVSSINEHPEWASTDVGIEGTGTSNSKFVLNLNNLPNFTINPVTIDRNLSTNRSDYRTTEFQQIGESAPRFSLEMKANAYNLSLFFWLLMQNGGMEDTTSTINRATFVPYTNDSIEIYTSIAKLMVDASTSVCNDTVSHFLLGCICESITLSSEERGFISLKAGMIGSSFKIYNILGKLQNVNNFPRLNRNPVEAGDNLTVTHNGTAYTTVSEISSDGFSDPADLDSLKCEVAVSAFTNSLTDEQIVIGDFNFPDDHINQIMKVKFSDETSAWSSFGLVSESSLKWQNSIIQLGDSSDTYTEIQIPSFSLTLSNNVTPKFSDESRCYGYSLGKFKGTGSFFIPFIESSEGGNQALDDYKYGIDKWLRLYWGTIDASNDGNFSLTMKIRYIDVQYSGDVEIGAQVNFEVVYDGTQQFAAICGYDSSKLKRGIS